MHPRFVQMSARQMHALSAQVVASVLTGSIDYAAVAELTTDLDGGHSDTKGAVAALHFCLVRNMGVFTFLLAQH